MQYNKSVKSNKKSLFCPLLQNHHASAAPPPPQLTIIRSPSLSIANNIAAVYQKGNKQNIWLLNREGDG